MKIVGVLLALPLVLLALLQTPPGKAVLASSLSRVLSSAENLDVRIGKISGWIPAKVDIESVEVGDAQGTWLTATELHFRWMIREVADERIRLKRISANTVELLRFPESGNTRKDKTREQEGFKPVEFGLDGLKIDHLRLGRGVAGIPLDYAVHSGGITLRDSGKLTGRLLVSGDAEGQVDLDASLVGNDADQLTIKAELDEMYKPTFGLDRLSGNAEATVSRKGVKGQVSVSLEENGQAGTLSGRLHYADRTLQLDQFELNAKDVAVSGNLNLGFSNQCVEVELTSAVADTMTNRYGVHGLATVATSNQSWAVEVHALDIRGWDTIAFSLAGTLTPEGIDLSGALTEFNVGQLPFPGLSNFTGRVNGQLTVNGSLDKPEIIAGVDVSGFSSAKGALDELPELDFSIAGGVRDGKLFGSTVMTNYSSGFLSADFAMPCSLSILPFNYQPDVNGFSGELKANLDFGIFNKLALLENQYLTGELKSDLRIDHGIPSGHLKLANGHYEHYDWGLVFRDLTADLEATKTGFVFKKAAATDGYAGGLKLSGGFGRGGLDVQLTLDGAKVLQRPEVEAQISGQLNLKGAVAHPAVSGSLVIDRADILLDNMVAAKPLVLTDFDAHARTNTVSGTRTGHALPFSMDIGVDMPDQTYVVASLIDSVWGGHLQLRDTPSGVSVSGKVQPRRGYVNFIGKKFRFQQTGEIVLDGAVPPAPVFNNLSAEYSRSDITARLMLNGRVNDPQYSLESTPAMPEDEILSQVLFNRDTTTISPYQAYQITAATRQLSGGLNGPGFMYQFRQAVGVDTLEWREADAAGGASSLAAGKYITPGLYVEVSSSLDGKSDTGMMAEYEITRHLSVESSTGPKMRPGIGVNWKADY